MALRTALAQSTRVTNVMNEITVEAEKKLGWAKARNADEILEHEEELGILLQTLTIKIDRTEAALDKLAGEADGLEEDDATSWTKFNDQQEKIGAALSRAENAKDGLQCQRERANFARERKRREIQDTQGGYQHQQQTPHEGGQPTNESREKSVSRNYTLPSITIPKFSGNRWEWTNFWKIFEELVDKTDLSNLMKFNHLNNNLEKEPRKLIQRYRVDDNNYEAAVKLLKKRYNDRGATLDELAKQLQAVKAEDDTIPEQRKTLDTITVLLAQLETMGEPIDTRMMKTTIITKFNLRIREKVYRRKQKVETEEWTIVKVMKDIEKEIASAEDVERNMEGEWHEFHTKDATESSESRKCAFCESPTHWAQHCEKVTNRMERRQIVEKKKLCKICFADSHPTRACTKTFICKRCPDDNHNGAICLKEFESARTKPTRKDEKRSVTVAKRKSYDSESDSDESSTEGKNRGENETEMNVTTATVQKSAFLPTLQAEAYNAKKKRWETISIMVDTGANQTYVAKDLTEKWGLPVTKEVRVKVRTFDEDNSMPKSYAETVISIRNGGSILKIKAHAANSLAGKLTKAPWTTEDVQYAMRHNLTINEDALTERVNPQMIMGCDYIGRIWKGNMINLPSGINLINTSLGYTTMGTRNSEKGTTKTSEESENEENEQITMSINTDEDEHSAEEMKTPIDEIRKEPVIVQDEQDTNDSLDTNGDEEQQLSDDNAQEYDDENEHEVKDEYVQQFSYSDEDRSSEGKSTTFSAVQSKTTTFLPTLKVEAYNRKKSEWSTISILVDTGANHTYITKKLQEEWNLPVLDSGQVKVRTFGSKGATRKMVLQTQIEIRSGEEILDISANTSQYLTGTLRKAPIAKEDHEFIRDKNLRINEDALLDNVVPQMVLGCDYIGKIWRGLLLHLPSGLLLMNSTVGYTTMGSLKKNNDLASMRNNEKDTEGDKRRSEERVGKKTKTILEEAEPVVQLRRKSKPTKTKGKKIKTNNSRKAGQRSHRDQRPSRSKSHLDERIRMNS